MTNRLEKLARAEGVEIHYYTTESKERVYFRADTGNRYHVNHMALLAKYQLSLLLVRSLENGEPCGWRAWQYSDDYDMATMEDADTPELAIEAAVLAVLEDTE